MANELKFAVVGKGESVKSHFGWRILKEGEEYAVDIAGRVCPRDYLSQGLVVTCPECGRFVVAPLDIVTLENGDAIRCCCECSGKYVAGRDFYDGSRIFKHEKFERDDGGNITRVEHIKSGHVIKCERCGRFELARKIYSVNTSDGKTQKWCSNCASNFSYFCEYCGKRFSNAVKMHYVDGKVFCDGCYSELSAAGKFITCPECGREVFKSHFDDELQLCRRCVHILGEINGYHSSHGHLSYYGAAHNGSFKGLGVELEVEASGQDEGDISRTVAHVRKIFNTNGEMRVFIEHDGSLDNGFEIITAPHTKQAFDALPLEDVCDMLKRRGCTSHNARTCGLHVHFSRTMFGHTVTDRERAIAKIAFFYSLFWDDILRASRRTAGQADRWASRYVLGDREAAEQYAKVNGAGRYSAINLNNSRTVEFRLGRGTLNAATIRAWIDLHYTLVQNARRISWADISDARKWLEGISSDTAAYLIRRGAFSSAFNNSEEV